MADLEKLTVLLEAQTKQFDSAMKRVTRLTDDTANKATRSLSRLDKQLNRTGIAATNMMKGLMAGAIGGLGIERLASSIGEAVKQMADLADEAQRAGVTAEQLQTIGFAAEQAGSSTSEMVEFLKKFNLEVGEALTKSNDLAKLFEANGVALRNQDGTVRSTRDLFYELVDLISRAKSQQEASAIAQMAGLKAASDTLPFLQQGAEAMKEQEQRARNIGAVISNEVIAKAAEFDDRWTAAWRTWEASAKTAIINAYDFMIQKGKDPGEMLPGGTSGAGAIMNWWNGTTPGPTPYGSGTGPGGMFSGNAGMPSGPATVLPQLEGASGAADSISGVGTAALDASTNLELMIGKMGEVDQGLLQAAEDAKRLQDTFKGAFADLAVAASDGKLKVEEVMGIIDGLRDQLIRMAAEKLFMLIFSMATGTPMMPGLLGLPGLASGGPMLSGKPYMVGEKGPELVIPDRSSYVVPNGRLGGGGNVDVRVINQGGIESTQRRSTSSGKEIIEIVNRVVEGRFPDLLNRNAPLIGARPVSKRTG